MSTSIVQFADQIQDSTVRDNFLSLMSAALIGGDVVGVACELHVTDSNPVWSVVDDYLQQTYGVTLDQLAEG